MKEYSYFDYVNTIFLILLCVLAGFTLGMKYGGGKESCETYVRLFGCEMQGYSVAETQRLLDVEGTNCRMICGNYTEEQKEVDYYGNFTFKVEN